MKVGGGKGEGGEGARKRGQRRGAEGNPWAGNRVMTPTTASLACYLAWGRVGRGEQREAQHSREELRATIGEAGGRRRGEGSGGAGWVGRP